MDFEFTQPKGQWIAPRAVPKKKRCGREAQKAIGRLVTAFAVAISSAATVLVTDVVAPTAAHADSIADALAAYPDKSMPCEHPNSQGVYATTGPCENYDWGPVHTTALGDPSTYSIRGYGYRNCTDWVAWRVQNISNGAVGIARGLGNANAWPGKFPISAQSTTAKPGDIAVSTSGIYGHVAFVESVSPDGSTMTVSEYNEDSQGDGDQRTIPASGSEFTDFINVGVNLAGSGSNYGAPHGYIDNTAAINAKATPGSGGWTQEVGPGNAVQFTMSGTYQIFLRGDGTVFAKNTMGPGNWVQETSPHSATAVAISDTGLQLIIGPDGSIESKTTIGFGGWTQEVGSGNASKIAVGGNTMMFLRGDGTVFAKVGAGGPWTQETSPNSASAIAVSNTGMQLMIVVNNEVDSRRGVGFGGWTQEVGPGNASAIALGGDNMMFLRGDGTVFSKVGQGGPWTQETSPNSATAIAVGENGLNMMLVVNGEVDTRQGPGAGGWTAETAPSSATAIAAG